MTTSIKFATPTGENIINFPSAGGSTYTFPSATGTIVTNDSTITLTNKTLTGATNTIEASGLRTNGASITISGATPPSINQVLKATSATTATWQDDYAGEGGGIYNATAPLEGADANGIIIDNILSEITLQYANATYPGIVSISAQSFTGTKTFNVVNLPTTTSSVGSITIAGTRFIHAYGTYNVFVGATSGNYTLTGSRNVGVGGDVLKSLSSGASNVAMGDFSMSLCTSGIQNTAVGLSSMINLTTGSYNTAIGKGSMQNATTAGSNACIGESSGININTAFGNTCIGVTSSTSGDSNTYVGYSSGDGSFGNSTTTIYNSSLGYESLKKTEGGYNIGIGYRGGYNLTTGSNNICIGNLGVAAETGIIRIGTSGTHTTTYIYGTIQSPIIAGIESHGTVASQRKIALWNTGTDFDYFGFGISTSQLDYNTGNTAAHVFYAGTSTTTKVEILRLASGAITVAGVLNLPTTSSTAGIINQNSIRFMHSYGSNNTFLGSGAGNFTNTSHSNTGIGYQVLAALTTGTYNTSVGLDAAFSVTTGGFNSVFGIAALNVLTTGSNNTAIGSESLRYVNTGGNNTCLGASSGNSYTSSESNNICIGYNVTGTLGESNVIRIGTNQTVTHLVGTVNIPIAAVSSYLSLPTTSSSTVGVIQQNGSIILHTKGDNNVFLGVNSGNFTMTTAQYNIGLGSGALVALTTGNRNNIIGLQAGIAITSGVGNVALGTQSLALLTTGNYNTCVGDLAGYNYTLSNSSNICIGAGVTGTVGESGVIRIGASQTVTYIAGVIQAPSMTGPVIAGIMDFGATVSQRKIALYNVGNDFQYYGFGVSGGQLDYHVNSSTDAHVFYYGASSVARVEMGRISNTALTLPTMINLPATTANVGRININTICFFHAYGSNNTFLGSNAGNFTLSGSSNTGLGLNTLQSTTTGYNNSAVGLIAMQNVTTGYNNAIMGVQAGYLLNTGIGNAGFGVLSLAQVLSGSNNTCVGTSAGSEYTSSESNNICIGSQVIGNVGESNVTRIGTTGQLRCFIGGIRGKTSDAADAIATLISSTGQLCTVSSDRRLKENFNYDVTTEAMTIIRNLKPCKFSYKSDSTGKLVWGLVAQEAAEVIPDYVIKLHGPKTRPPKQVIKKVAKPNASASANTKNKDSKDIADEIEYIDVIEYVEDTEPIPESPEDNDHTIQYHMIPLIMLAEMQRQQNVIEVMQTQNTQMQAQINTMQVLIDTLLARV